MRNTNITINRIPIAKARINLGSVAKRAHLGGEYFILEMDGIPIAGLMDADELEDYLELRDPNVKKQIQESRKDYEAVRVRDASELLAELRGAKGKKTVRPRKRAFDGRIRSKHKAPCKEKSKDTRCICGNASDTTRRPAQRLTEAQY